MARSSRFCQSINPSEISDGTSFLVALFTAVSLCLNIDSLSKTLQSKQSDLKSAMQSAENILETLQQTRSNADEHFSLVFKWLQDTITPLRIELDMPRLCSRQMHRANHNIESDDIEGYYRVSVFLPFLDKTIEQMQVRFTEKKPKLLVYFLYFASLPASEAESSFSNLWKTYSPTLHGNHVEPQDTIGLKGQSEFRQWICKWKRTPADNMPNTLLSSLQACDKHVFPTINALLNISDVIPVSTATPERTF